MYCTYFMGHRPFWRQAGRQYNWMLLCEHVFYFDQFKCPLGSHTFSPGMWIVSYVECNVSMSQLYAPRGLASNFEPNMQEIGGNRRVQLVYNV